MVDDIYGRWITKGMVDRLKKTMKDLMCESLTKWLNIV